MSNETCSKCSTKIEGDVVHILFGDSGIEGCCRKCWDKEPKPKISEPMTYSIEPMGTKRKGWIKSKDIYKGANMIEQKTITYICTECLKKTDRTFKMIKGSISHNGPLTCRDCDIKMGKIYLNLESMTKHLLSTLKDIKADWLFKKIIEMLNQDLKNFDDTGKYINSIIGSLE